MRRPSLPRRRKRNRVVRAYERTVHRVATTLLVVRTLVRHRLAAR
jgi:hypothetical protein